MLSVGSTCNDWDPCMCILRSRLLVCPIFSSAPLTQSLDFSMRTFILLTGIIETLCSTRSSSIDSSATAELYPAVEPIRSRTESIDISDPFEDFPSLRRTDSTDSVETVVVYPAAVYEGIPVEAEEIPVAGEKFYIGPDDIEFERINFHKIGTIGEHQPIP